MEWLRFAGEAGSVGGALVFVVRCCLKCVWVKKAEGKEVIHVTHKAESVMKKKCVSINIGVCVCVWV